LKENAGASYSSGAGLWAGENELQHEDSMRAFARDIVPRIKAAATKLSFPQKLIYMAEVYIDRYDPRVQGFSLHWRHSISHFNAEYVLDMNILAPLTHHRVDNLGLYLEGFKQPSVLRMSEQKAHDLMGALFGSGGDGRRDALVGFEIELTGLTKRLSSKRGGSRHAIHGNVKSLKIYSISDTDLTTPVHTFARTDFIDNSVIQANKKAKQESKRKKGLKRIAFKDGTYFAATYASLSGSGMASLEPLLPNLVRSSDPFQQKEELDNARNLISNAMTEVNPDEPIWVKGGVLLKKYEMDGGYFPVKSSGIHLTKTFSSGEFPIYKLISGQYSELQMGRLPIPSDIARELAKTNPGRKRSVAVDIAYRALVKPSRVYPPEINGKKSNKQARGKLEFEIIKLELLKGRSDIALKKANVLDDHEVVWTYEPGNLDKLEIERDDQIAKERSEKIVKRKQSVSNARDKLDILGVKLGMTLGEAERALAGYLSKKSFERFTSSLSEVSKRVGDVKNGKEAYCRLSENCKKEREINKFGIGDSCKKEIQNQSECFVDYAGLSGSLSGWSLSDEKRYVFHDGVAFRDKEKKESIVLYYFPIDGVDRIVSVTRNVDYSNNLKATDIRGKVKEKYGEPSFTSRREMYYGSMLKPKQGNAFYSCNSLLFNSMRYAPWIREDNSALDILRKTSSASIRDLESYREMSNKTSGDVFCGPVLGFRIRQSGSSVSMNAVLMDDVERLMSGVKHTDAEIEKLIDGSGQSNKAEVSL
jgi:hypothetical protein